MGYQGNDEKQVAKVRGRRRINLKYQLHEVITETPKGYWLM